MQSQQDIDRVLERWGEQLLRPGLRRYGVPGSDPSARRPAPLSGPAIRAGLRAIVTHTPEVMVKVTGGGRGMAAIKAHMTYISRKGELTLENQDGLQLKGKEDLADLADEWRYGGGLIPEASHRREAFHLMFSMPPGTDPQAVYNAARALAREEFAKHKYALVLHDPATDRKSRRPHVHMIVRAQSRDWKRLQPKKADLARWRQEFADRLLERGVAASATRRQSRGVVQPTMKLRDYHRGAGREDRLIQPGPGVRRTEHEVLEAWQNVAEALSNSENGEDRNLGQQIVNFKGGMQAVVRAMHQMRQRKIQIALDVDRQELLALARQPHPQRQSPSLER